MGLGKLGLFLLVLLLHLHHHLLLHVHAHGVLLKTFTKALDEEHSPINKEMPKKPAMTPTFRRVKSVIRRGGFSAAHGGGGGGRGGINGGGRGNGGKGRGNGPTGLTVVPLYAGAIPHRQNNHHHGRNKGNIKCVATVQFALAIFTTIFLLFLA